MSEFVSAAPPAGGIQWADHKGSLLIIEPLEFRTAIKTSFGDKDAVEANVYVLTGPDTADEYASTLVFPTLLASQLKNQIGKKVVGRLNQGQAKPGQAAPWLLDAASEEDIEKARGWLEKSQPVVTSASAPF